MLIDRCEDAEVSFCGYSNGGCDYYDDYCDHNKRDACQYWRVMNDDNEWGVVVMMTVFAV